MKTTPLPLLRISSSLILLALSGVTAMAQTTTWNDPATNNFWNVAGNWSNGVPTTTTDVIVSGTGGTILLNADTNGLKSLKVTGDNSIYTLSSSDSTVRKLTTGAAGGFGVAQDTKNLQLTIEGVSARFNAGSSFAYNGSGNSLTLTGSGTVLMVAYPGGFSIGSGNGTVDANSNNSVTVKDGALLDVAFIGVGGTGAGNTLLVTGTGSKLSVAGVGVNHDLKVGNGTSAATNSVKIVNGATAEVKGHDTKIAGGSLIIGKGSSLVHTSVTSVQTLSIGDIGVLYGAGSITVDILQYNAALNKTGSVPGPGAKVYVGETTTDYGKLDFTGEWQNTKITLNLQVGDLTGGAVAGVNYDLLNVNGVFALGGDVSIDTSAVLFGTLDEIKLIQWASFTGNESDLHVTFINGSAYAYVIRQDGLYLQATVIPEPGAMAFLVLGACGLGFGIRNRKV